jgi:hypothetical protein
MSKQTNENEQMNLRAKMLKRQTQKKQQAENNRRRIKSGKAPSMVVQLKSINQYKKLICYSEEKSTMETILMMDERYHKEGERSPVWIDPNHDGVFFKASIPKFMHGSLFKYDDMVGRNVNIMIQPKTYESEDYGNGFYFALNGELTLADE